MKILNTDRISWNGQPLAVVVADTEEQAEYAASLVRVTYRREPAITSFNESIPHATTPKDILGESPQVAKGDPDAALKSASHTVDLTFTPALQPQRDRAARHDRHVGRRPRHGLRQQSIHRGDRRQRRTRAWCTARERSAAGTVRGRWLRRKGRAVAEHAACVMAAVVGRPVRFALTRAGVFRIVGGRTP